MITVETDRIYSIYTRKNRINPICLSQNAIDQLKQYVKEGVLVPDEDRVKREYKVPEDIMSGKYLFPQMVYVKQ